MSLNSPAFRGERYFLSNMYTLKQPLIMDDSTKITVASLENVFQALKFADSDIANQVLSAPTGYAAKRLARNYLADGAILKDQWNDRKIEIMSGLVRAKFNSDAKLQELLLATDNEELVEYNPWRDDFWGVRDDTGEGRNELGKILMTVREELRRLKLIDS